MSQPSVQVSALFDCTFIGYLNSTVYEGSGPAMIRTHNCAWTFLVGILS